jgi:hypothetical protein
LALFAFMFVVYRSNGYESFSGDTLATTLLAYTLVDQHKVDLDAFAGTYAKTPGMSYAFFRSPLTGQLTSAFPIGSALLVTPIYAYFDWSLKRGGAAPDVTSLAFEPRRLHFEKVAASLVAALSVVLFFLCARLFVRPLPAWIATGAYGLGTNVWAMNSQNLYQHGPSNLAILALIGCCAMALRSRRPAPWLLLAGLCAGFMIVIRPTNVFYALPAAAFVVARFRARSVPFVVAALAGYAPGLIYDLHFFGRPIGGYPTQITPYVWDARFFGIALTGLLASPNRGLFVFSPVLLGALAGAARLRAHAQRDDVRLLAAMTAGAVVMLLSYAFYNMWWGGFAYGPRFLIDTLPVLCLLLAFALPNVILSALLALSVLIQAFGAYAGAAGSSWNSVPVSVDEYHDRIWQLHDGEIERYARATYYVIVGNPAVKPGYAQGFAGTVDAAQFVPAALPDKLEVRATVRNTGTSVWYGYASGVYLGQARVAASVLDEAQRVVASGYLYVEGNPRPGERAIAFGDFAVPGASLPHSVRTAVVPFGLRPFTAP